MAIVAIAVSIITLGDPADTPAASERTVTARQGVVQETVSGSGNLAPANEVDLDFGASGKVTKIYVKEGQHVSAGDLLARIDSRSAEVDVAQAKAELESAQATLDSAEASGSSTTASTSTAAVKATAAQATTPTTTTTAPVTPTTTTPAATTPAKTQTTTTPARTSGGGSGGSGSSSGGSSSGGGSQTSVASAQAAVDSAELAVEEAEQALDETVLRAPVPGTVSNIDGAVGETAGSSASSSSSSSDSSSSSGPSVSGGLGGGGSSTSSTSSSGSGFITLSQISRYRIEVSLSESDIGAAKVGQSATVTVNAASGEQYEARVTKVGLMPSSSSSTSAVSYPVTLTLLQSAKALKPGMSATADIVTKQASGIVVPSQALSGSSVTVLSGGKRETRRVTTGVVGDSSTQIVSGLQAGDAVVVRSQSAAAGAATRGTTGAATQGTQGQGTGLGSRTGLGGGTGGATGGGFGGGRSGFGGGGGAPPGGP
jgi:multidrug efflux pump subunit AcrA (membrane-fusion protein)